MAHSPSLSWHVAVVRPALRMFIVVRLLVHRRSGQHLVTMTADFLRRQRDLRFPES